MSELINNIYYSEADKILVAVDCVIFGFDNEKLKLLLFKRKVKPFKDEWSLIGRFVNNIENVSTAAQKVLEECTGLTDVYLEQLRCYGDCGRDPGGRVISMAYYSLIRLNEGEEKVVENYQARWFNIGTVPPLILDHNEMVKDAFNRLQTRARHQPVGFELLPQKFTIPKLQTLYEAIYQKELDRRNFRKKILSMGILEKLDEKDKDSSRKGAFLYRFNQQIYEEMVTDGFDFVL